MGIGFSTVSAARTASLQHRPLINRAVQSACYVRKLVVPEGGLSLKDRATLTPDQQRAKEKALTERNIRVFERILKNRFGITPRT